MSPEKDKELCEKYPKIFINRNSKISKNPISWGITCGDGWFEILNTACSLIQDRCDLVYKREGKDIQVIALQIKEKFGSLRFYVVGGDDYIRGIIAMAESSSTKICEDCGDAGKLYNEGWWITQCEKCRKKYFEVYSNVDKQKKESEI
jgi:hypothetical protein